MVEKLKAVDTGLLFCIQKLKKWFDTSHNLKKVDIILIKDELMSLGQWPFCRKSNQVNYLPGLSSNRGPEYRLNQQL